MCLLRYSSSESSSEGRMKHGVKCLPSGLNLGVIICLEVCLRMEG
jgi:hypothetical protein